MLIAGTVAWFTSDVTEISAQTVVIDTGGEKLEAKLYLGNDIDRDGTLDTIHNSSGNIVDVSTLSRQEILDKQYTEISFDSGTGLLHSECLPGVKLTYRLVVKNPNDFNVSTDMSLSKLDDYFETAYSAVGLDTDGNISTYNGQNDLSGLDTLVGENSARIMFNMNSITATDFTQGNFNSIGQSGKPIEIADNSYDLWEISSGNKFAQGIEIPAGDYLEYDFVIECKQLQDILDSYANYVQSQELYTLANADTKAKIDAFVQYELDYITKININESGGTATTRKMMFTISYLSIKGVQK